jgi:hypothetical protein
VEHLKRTIYFKESSNLLHSNSVHFSAHDKGIRGLYDFPFCYRYIFDLALCKSVVLQSFCGFSFLNGLLSWVIVVFSELRNEFILASLMHHLDVRNNGYGY